MRNPLKQPPVASQWRDPARLPQKRYESDNDFQSTFTLSTCAVKAWMDANPENGRFLSEFSGRSDPLPLVVTLLIVNSDNLAATQFASVFVAAGLDSISYSPQSASLPASGWPTLGSLIDAKTRLVTFLSTTASFDAVPYLIDGEWSTLHNLTPCSLP